MISPGTEHLDKAAVYQVRTLNECRWDRKHPHMRPEWHQPTTADQVIACNRIDLDLKRLLEEREMRAIEKRSGY